MQPYQFTRSETLFERARKVIPGGIYGHQTPRLQVMGSYPYFFERGQGAHVWDIDGNEYIDYMCSYGPIVLGHRHPKVEEAARRQAELGNCFNAPSPLFVELAEHLVSITPCADWAAFGKNGSDVCTWAVEIARHATGRAKVIKAADAYHGTHSWCTPVPNGLTPEDTANVLTFKWNDLEGLGQTIAAHRGQVAAVILTPFHHVASHDSEMASEGFLPGVRKLCDDNGIVFIMDDVRCGFRLHLGGSGELFGVRPDLSTYCKAIGNGYPLAACVGRENLKRPAAQVFFTGSYFTSAVPMAAALACLKELAACEGIARMRTIGERLRDGMLEQARSHGFAVTWSGPPAMPYMTFKADRGEWDRLSLFCAAAARRGVYFHPRHNWFISAAHSEQDVRRTLDVTDSCFKAVREKFGA